MVIRYRKDNGRFLWQAVKEKRSIDHNKTSMLPPPVCMSRVSRKGKVVCTEGKPGARWLDPVVRPQPERMQEVCVQRQPLDHGKRTRGRLSCGRSRKNVSTQLQP